MATETAAAAAASSKEDELDCDKQQLARMRPELQRREGAGRALQVEVGAGTQHVQLGERQLQRGRWL